MGEAYRAALPAGYNLLLTNRGDALWSADVHGTIPASAQNLCDTPEDARKFAVEFAKWHFERFHIAGGLMPTLTWQPA